MHGVPVLLVIAGGVALILSGAASLRKGLDRMFGPRLNAGMQRLTNGSLRAFLAGLVASVVSPSSTSMSLLAVQTVRAGQLPVRTMLAMMLGANIGITAMVLLIALRIEAYWPVLVVPGVVLYQFTQRSRSRGTGQAVLGLGLIFLGIDIIKRAAGSVEPGGDFIRLMEIAAEYPWFMASLASIMAIGMQSSTATIGLTIGLAGAGAINLPLAIAAVVGVNVGIALTTLIFGWSQIDSRRLAIGNLLAKLVIAILVLLLRDGLAQAIEHIPGSLTHRIAYVHTGFNIIMALLFLPLLSPFSRLLVTIVPEPSGAAGERFGPRYINMPVEGLTLALGQSSREIVRVAEIVRSMLSDVWRALCESNEALAVAAAKRDDEVDLLDREIKRYLTALFRLEGDQPEAGEQMLQLSFLNELETVGDIIDKNLSEMVLKKIHTGITFSPEGWAELNDVYEQVMRNMLIAENVFTTRDPALAAKLLENKESLNRLERELRERHFERLNAGLAISHESSAVHLDLLANLKRINSALAHVAYGVAQP